MYSSRMTRIVTLAKRLTTPLLPDDYLTLSTRYSHSILTVPASARSTKNSGVRTLHLRTARNLPAFRAGQHVRVGVDLRGVRHVRSFSITSAATGMAARELTITVKATGQGGVSDHLVHRAVTGDIVYLEQASGDFVLPAELPDRIVMIAAGSGVTPAVDGQDTRTGRA